MIHHFQLILHYIFTLCYAHSMNDYTISLGNTFNLPNFLPVFQALCFLLQLVYFSEIYVSRLGKGQATHVQGVEL